MRAPVVDAAFVVRSLAHNVGPMRPVVKCFCSASLLETGWSYG